MKELTYKQEDNIIEWGMERERERKRLEMCAECEHAIYDFIENELVCGLSRDKICQQEVK